MTEMFYAIYSKAHDGWFNADGKYVPISQAEKYRKPLDTMLEGDECWVGPLNEGDYE